MGPIVDHDTGKIVKSDLLVVRTRRKMLDAMRAWEKDKTCPGAQRIPNVPSRVWSGHVIAPNGQDMGEVYSEMISKVVVAAA